MITGERLARHRPAVVLLLTLSGASADAVTAMYRERFVFTGDRGHVHASSVVETPGGSARRLALI